MKKVKLTKKYIRRGKYFLFRYFSTVFLSRKIKKKQKTASRSNYLINKMQILSLFSYSLRYYSHFSI